MLRRQELVRGGRMQLVAAGPARPSRARRASSFGGRAASSSPPPPRQQRRGEGGHDGKADNGETRVGQASCDRRPARGRRAAEGEGDREASDRLRPLRGPERHVVELEILGELVNLPRPGSVRGLREPHWWTPARPASEDRTPRLLSTSARRASARSASPSSSPGRSSRARARGRGFPESRHRRRHRKRSASQRPRSGGRAPRWDSVESVAERSLQRLQCTRPHHHRCRKRACVEVKLVLGK